VCSETGDGMSPSPMSVRDVSLISGIGRSR
jgi:hypothetical protein